LPNQSTILLQLLRIILSIVRDTAIKGGLRKLGKIRSNSELSETNLDRISAKKMIRCKLEFSRFF